MRCLCSVFLYMNKINVSGQDSQLLLDYTEMSAASFRAFEWHTVTLQLDISQDGGFSSVQFARINVVLSASTS